MLSQKFFAQFFDSFNSLFENFFIALVNLTKSVKNLQDF